MRVAFFHGLESRPISTKNIILTSEFDFVYSPKIDYKDTSLFDQILHEVKINQIDLLIGSSMGGWLAYCISTCTGIPTLLFNPAVHSRPWDPIVKLDRKKSEHTVVLGKRDCVIDPNTSIDWFTKNGIGQFHYNFEFFEHRIPIDVFTKWIINSKNNFLSINKIV